MRKRKFLVSCLLIAVSLGLIPLSAYSQQGAEPQSPYVPKPSAEALVTAIEVQGNKAISTNIILSKMKTRVGSPYLENVASDDLKRLYLLGYFSDIKIDTQPFKDGIKVVIAVVERPIIEKIVFSGVRRLAMSEQKLKASLKSKEAQYLDYPNLAEDVKTLSGLYEKRGYSQAHVEYQVDLDKATNKANVKFSVVEGKRLKIKKIFVEGNKAFPDGRILKLMKTKAAWLFNAGSLKEEVLKEDIERVKSFYHRNGYIDVTAEYEIKVEPKKPLIYIAITIQEGRKYLVGMITIQGNKDISQALIMARLKVCTPGAVFSQEGVKDDVINIQGLYFDKGYIAAGVQESTSLNARTGRIDITYTVTENEIAYVDKIKIKGNIKTREVVIRREVRIRPGERFDGDKLRRTKERLQNLGFFEEVSYDTEDTDVPNKKDLVVEVKEAKTGSFSFGGGYSTVDQFIGFAEVEQKNFDWKNFPYFTGAGQNLKLRFSMGTVSNGFNLSFTEPWLFDYPVSFGFDAYKESRERDSDVGYGYDEDVTGGDLRLGRELSEYVRADMKYRFDSIKISNVTEDATQDLRDEIGQNNISSLELGATFDNRDNVFDPVKGNLLNASVEWAGGPFAGDKDFVKFYSRASRYFPMFRGSSLELRARVGIANPYGDSEKVPIYERFFAGGAYTIRGYHERKIGPIDPVSEDPLGGESLLIGNVEYLYPILNFLKVAGFYDIGNVWEKAGDLGQGGLKASVGFGFRLKTPIGPLMLDYGIPLNKEPGENEKGSGRFHFSMSHGF